MFRIAVAATLALLFAVPSFAARLFVVSKEQRALEVYDESTGKLEFRISAPGEPHEVVVSPDGKFAYLADFEGLKNIVSIVDLDAKAIAHSIPVTPSYKPHGMDLSADGSKLYVTCEASRVVAEIDTQARKVARTFQVNEHATHVLALSPDGKTVYTASSDAGNISIIDVASGELMRSVISGKGCEGITVTPDGAEVWTANRVSQTVAVIDLKQKKRVQTLAAVGNPLRIAITPDGTTAVVSCAVAGELLLIDRARRAELGRIAVGDFPIGIVFDRAGKTAYVTNAKGNEVAVVDLAARKVTRRIPVGGDPEGIALFE